MRIFFEGLSAANGKLSGLKEGFDYGLRTLLMLRHMWLKGTGFGFVVA